MSLITWIKDRFLSKAVDLRFAAHSFSAQGLVRPDNQDSIVCCPERGFFCVADGMGGASAGARASQWVCEALTAALPHFADFRRSNADRATALNVALQGVNDRIRAYVHEKGYKSMGSTVVLVQILTANGSRALVAHAGDSRLYRLREGVLRQLTRDHTFGEMWGERVKDCREAADLKSRANPYSHVLTRAVGTEYKVRADWKLLDIRLGDRFLLCSDGVHDMLSDDQIATLLDKGSPTDVVERLSCAILAAGACDNYSIVHFQAERQTSAVGGEDVLALCTMAKGIEHDNKDDKGLI